MGQQQLLLIILGVIVVGIAVAVGLTMFADSAINANRNSLTNDLIHFTSRAQQYYRRPTTLGGGGSKFDALTDIYQLTNKPTNANGSYTLKGGTGSGPMYIDGYGTELGDDGNPVHVQAQVYSDRDSIYILN